MNLFNKKGFSLIELLVVVAIIGILAAVGVVAYNGYTKAAKANATKANHDQVYKYVQSILLQCEMGSAPGFKNSNGYQENYKCDNAGSLRSTLWLYLLESGIKNPYDSKFVGVWIGSVYGSIDRKNGAESLERKAPDRRYPNNFYCCAALGLTQLLKRPPDFKIYDTYDNQYPVCNGSSCCFDIITAYDVDSDNNAKVKINVATGDSCTK